MSTEPEPVERPKRGRPPRYLDEVEAPSKPVKPVDPVVDELRSLRALVLNRAEAQEKMIKTEGQSKLTWCREYVASEYLDLARWIEFRMKELESRDQDGGADPGGDRDDGGGEEAAG